LRAARGIAVVAVLVLLLRPELPRYRAEHALHGGSGALRFVVTRPGEISDPAAALGRIGAVADEASRALPADPRPWILAGSARLVAGEPARALEAYRSALAAGERAETDLNLGRVWEALGDPDKSRASYVRAAWISPALLPLLLPDVAEPIAREVARLEAELQAGRLKQPPALPQ
jgi:tetratricopeptide (TPR) repeat protein